MANYGDDIVVSGIGGYFPGCKNIAEWKRQIFENEIYLEEKWAKGASLTKSNIVGGVTTDRFDNTFFGIHRSHTDYMDINHRLSLERTFEALIDAGVNPNSLKGKNIGCFLGMTIDECNNLYTENIVNGLGLTGHSKTMLPNRISYWLDLKGPSVAYDSNWISGMEVIRLACDSIRNGQSEAAIVGASNVVCHPGYHQLHEELNLISSDGKTKAFDANAQGYGRSDGVVILYIQKKSDAKRCYCSIVHINTLFDGCTKTGLLAVDGKLMTSFLEDFFQKSPVPPSEIDYVETYGCGKKDIDKAELDAIEAVYCKNRPKPLLIGAVKTQSGHSESCSNLFSLVKVILAMEEEKIPATLNIENLNPEIKGLHNGSLEIVRTNTKWSSDYAAINGIGINNYFGHMIIKRNSKSKVEANNKLPRFLPVSTRTEETVQLALETLKDKPEDIEFQRLVHDVFGINIANHMYRGYLLQGQDNKKESSFLDDKKREVWFVYSGMGSQWNGMLSDFMKFPVFAHSIKNSHNVLKLRGVDLMNLLTSSEADIFNNILNSFVGIAAMQIALTDLLNALNIIPDGIIGHSQGELGCAYADGCITAEQMLLASLYRGAASLEANLVKGSMAAVGLGYNQIKDLIPPGIEVACHNGSGSCTISGPSEDVEKYVEQLRNKGVFVRLVNTGNIAYHSQYTRPIAPIFHNYAKDHLPKSSLRSPKWISTSNKAENWNTDLAKYSSVDYFTNNMLGTVLFEEGCKYIPKDSILIEIAPHGLMQAILKRSDKDFINIPLTNKTAKSGVEFLLQNIGRLYLLGLDLNFAGLYPTVDFPVCRNTPSLTDLAGWNHSEKWESFDISRTERFFVDDKLSLEDFKELHGHEIRGNIVVPVSWYLTIVCQKLCCETKVLLFETLNFRKHLVLSKTSEIFFHLNFHRCSGEFEFWSDQELILSGKVKIPEDSKVFNRTKNEDEFPYKNYMELSENDIYDEFLHRGYSYTGSFRTIKNLKINNKGSVAKIACDDKWPLLIDGILQQYTFFSGEKYQNVQLPQLIQEIWVDTQKFTRDIREANYDFALNSISASGVEIRNITMVEWNEGQLHMVLESVNYINLDRMIIKDISTCLEFAIQLTRASITYRSNNKTILVTDLFSRNSLYEELGIVATELSHLNVNVSTTTNVKDICVQMLYPHLIVMGDAPTDELLRKISSSDIFLLTRTTDFALAFPGIVEITRMYVDQVYYSVLRQAYTTDVAVVNTENEMPNIADIKEGKAIWFTNLKETAKASAYINKPIYLISSWLPKEGVEYFIQEIKQQPHMQNVHFLFNLDNFKGDLSSIFQKKLLVSILQDGEICSCVYQLSKFRNGDNHKLSFGIIDKINNTRFKDTIQYTSLNLHDETIDHPIRYGLVRMVDFSAVDSDGIKIMGLAQISDDCSEIERDPIFNWKVPEKFLMTEAATISHAYLSAYYMVKVIGKLQSTNNVLIHAGCSPVGLASIVVSHLEHSNIYTTVFNLQQKNYLLKTFDFLQPKNIFFLNDTSFKSKLMHDTRGDGASLVLNCLPGEYLQASLDCCGRFSTLIHYGKYDLEHEIGMLRFMLNVSFYLIDLNNLMNLNNDTKQQLWNLMNKGLKEILFHPLKQENGSHNEVQKIPSNLKNGTSIIKKVLKSGDPSDTKRLVSTPSGRKFTCFPKRSYIVCGGSDGSWIDVVEWLAHHGATTIIVTGDGKIYRNKFSRRLALLNEYFNVNLIFSKYPLTTDTVEQFLKETSVLFPIGAIFLVPNKFKIFTKDQHSIIKVLVDRINQLAPEASVINLIPEAVGICQSRANAGFKILSITMTKDAKIRNGLDALNHITDSGQVIMQEKIISAKNISGIGHFLPTPSEIIEEQKYSASEPGLVRMITEGPENFREIAPVFIIQGITGKMNVKKMTTKLLYPTYCTVLPCSRWPIEKVAETYAQKIEETYPGRVYNLVSVTTAGTLMLEIAKKLKEKRNDIHLQLFFIDSAPTIIQEALMQLGEVSDYEVNILRNIFDITDVKVLEKLVSLKSFDDRLKYCSNLSTSDQTLLERGLPILKDILDFSKQYKPQGLRITGNEEIHLLRPRIMDQSDDCGLINYCQRKPIIKLIDGDPLSIISHPDTVEYINFNVAVEE